MNGDGLDDLVAGGYELYHIGEVPYPDFHEGFTAIGALP